MTTSKPRFRHRQTGKSARRRTAVTAACLASLLLASGCAGSSGSTDGETLTIALPSDVTTLDPWETRSVGTDLSVLSQIYTPLVGRDDDLELVPALAESWEQTEDHVWTFHLRDDITFANGAPLDAEVAAWNINELAGPDATYRAGSSLSSIIEARAADATTLEVHTERIDASVTGQLAMIFFVEPEWRESHDPATETMPSGPYELTSRNPQSDIVLELQDDVAWFGEEPAHQTVRYRIIPEESAQVASLQTGEVDIAAGFGIDQLEALGPLADLETGAVESTRVAMLYADVSQEPMDDPRVRQAINYAVDIESIVEQLFAGETSPSPGQFLTEAYSGFNEELEPYPHDPRRAQELLAEAGHPEGLELDLIYPTGSPALIPEQVVQALTAQLAEVGVTVNASSMPNADFVDMNYQRTDLPDLGYISMAMWTLDGADLLELLGASTGSQQFWQNDEFDALIEDALAATGEERAALTSEAAAVMREDAGFVFLFPQPLTYAHSAEVAFHVREDGWILAYDVAPQA